MKTILKNCWIRDLQRGKAHHSLISLTGRQALFRKDDTFYGFYAIHVMQIQAPSWQLYFVLRIHRQSLWELTFSPKLCRDFVQGRIQASNSVCLGILRGFWHVELGHSYIYASLKTMYEHTYMILHMNENICILQYYCDIVSVYLCIYKILWI